MKIHFEIEKEKLRSERDKFKAENEIQRNTIEELHKEKGDENGNKENIYAEYEKKMATLNLEIAFNKNIYDSLLQARARAMKNSRRSALEEIEEDASRSESSKREE